VLGLKFSSWYQDYGLYWNVMRGLFLYPEDGTGSFETLVPIYQTTEHHIPED
jgi:hypothetical protein